ncbi:hypothetical protein Ccar_16435 [Clostridium carboxidivorans P7]|uniref:hemolysin XhlA family protein n=1 Tax=Clostridium carboxidivorans TaxID=217159 RepID=UPI00064F1435|nr:hemolysin XhlA family protein [Clostridium carboxidivorans]AKN32364.1 hypothetical protein Ccar_16435 [Clostridium carboxidivorans P7]
MSYDEKVCGLKHKQVKETLDKHEKRLDEHDKKFENLDKIEAVHSEQILSLCKRLDRFSGIMMVMLGALVGFFFYAIQHNIFK